MQNRLRIYIAGPMRHHPFYNAPAFIEAAEMLSSRGHAICSPVEMDIKAGLDAMALPADTDWSVEPEGFDMEACFDRDIKAVKECDAIFLLKGWKGSTGASMEWAVAKFLGKKILISGQTMPETVAGPLPPEPKSKQPEEDKDEPTESANPPSMLTPSAPGMVPKWSILPTDSAERKTYPIYSGFMAYFPRAIAAVAHLSYEGNEKHNPGQSLHWSRDKSSDHADCIGRHMLEQGLVAIAWRAMAQLEISLEEAGQKGKVLEPLAQVANNDEVLSSKEVMVRGCMGCRHDGTSQNYTSKCQMCRMYRLWASNEEENRKPVVPEPLAQVADNGDAISIECSTCRHDAERSIANMHNRHYTPCKRCRLNRRYKGWEPKEEAGQL